jgi:hypothetical protein
VIGTTATLIGNALDTHKALQNDTK